MRIGRKEEAGREGVGDREEETRKGRRITGGREERSKREKGKK